MAELLKKFEFITDKGVSLQVLYKTKMDYSSYLIISIINLELLSRWLIQPSNHSDSAPNFFPILCYFWSKNEMIFPCSYCALPYKTKATYVEVLEAIKITVKQLGIYQ